jgi:hypothetical protein
MQSLINLQLEKALAYPVIDPSINLLFSALLIWEKVELIWGEDREQLEHFKDYAEKSPIFYDKGLVTLKEPKPQEIDKASKELKKLKPDYEKEIANDEGFGNNFIINPVKVTHAYWKNARRRKDAFIVVPKNVGRLYLGLLACEMSKRMSDPVPTLTTRLEEPLFLEGGIKKVPQVFTPDECIAKACLNTVAPVKDLDELSNEEVNQLCKDIIELRKLDSWMSWREELLSYKQKLQDSSTVKEVTAITQDLNKKVDDFSEEAIKQNLIIVGKAGICVMGGVFGFFVGSIPGAIVGAGTAFGALGFDLYQASNERKKRKQSAQQFIIDSRKLLSKYKEWYGDAS